MSCFFLPFLLALLTVQQCTSLPVLSSNRNPSATLERFSDFLLTPRQVHNSQSSFAPFTYPLPTNPSLALRFTGIPGARLDQRDTLHALTSIRLTLTKRMTTTGDRNDPIPLRLSRSNRYVHAELGRYGSDPSEGPRDGKSEARGRVLTLEEGVQVVGAMYAMMKERGFRARWAEVVEKGDKDGGGVVVGFVRVTDRRVGAPGL